jgi:DNA-binding SARP family transcriptional activator
MPVTSGGGGPSQGPRDAEHRTGLTTADHGGPHRAAEPTQERFAELLMTALYRGGHRADALRVFHTLRAELGDQLGVPPTAAVQRLFSEIVQDRPGCSLEVAAVRRTADGLPRVADHRSRGLTSISDHGV